MTERIKTWVMAAMVVIVLEVIRTRHLGIGPEVLWYVLAIFSTALILYWLPPREKGILRGWLVVSLLIATCGALFLAFAAR